MSEQTFLQFQTSSSVFGLPVSNVVEIVRIAAFKPVPDPTPDLLGMINVRGQVIPVFDLCRTLGLGERPISLRMYIVIADVGGESIGILVDDVLDVVRIPESQYHLSRALAPSNTFTAGVIRRGDEMLTVLDLRPLLDRKPEPQPSELA